MELALDYRIYKSYRVVQKIGKGVYGEVFKAVEKSTGNPVAIKKIIDAFQNLIDAKRTYRELGYLLQIHHPCIIGLQRVIVDETPNPTPASPHNVYAVFQLMNLDLAKTIQHCALEGLQRKYLLLQVTCALKYLHESGLIHRDIKPSNILVDESCTAKICDFGLVRRIEDFSRKNHKDDQIFTEYVASKWYRAPEIMLNGNHRTSEAIDMWSLGCVAAEMIIGRPLFAGNSMIEQLEGMLQIIGMPLEQQIDSLISEDSKFLLRNFHKVKRVSLQEVLGQIPEMELDFISNLLVFDPKKRMTAAMALKHPFFDELEGHKNQFVGVPVTIVDHSEQKKAATMQDYRHLIQALCIQTKRSNTSCRSRESRESISSISNLQHRQLLMKQDHIDIMPDKSTRSSNCGLRKHADKGHGYRDMQQDHEVQEFYKVVSRPGSQATLLSCKSSSNKPMKTTSKNSKHQQQQKNRSQSRQSLDKKSVGGKVSNHSVNKPATSKSKQKRAPQKSMGKTKIYRPGSQAQLLKNTISISKPNQSRITKKKKKP